MSLAILSTEVLAIATLLGNALTILLLLAWIFAKPLYRSCMRILADRALIFGFLIATVSTLGAFLYSEITGFAACILCWIQRMFIFPQMFLLGLAAWRSDRAIIPYALMLSVLGALVALYNWVKDMLALYTKFSLACPVVPGLPSCDRILVLEYGYITIAMISLNVFVLLAIIFYAALRSEKYADA